MSMYVNMHFRNRDEIPAVRLRSGVVHANGEGHAYISLTDANNASLSLFFESVPDMEMVANELETLARTIREEGWDYNRKGETHNV